MPFALELCLQRCGEYIIFSKIPRPRKWYAILLSASVHIPSHFVVVDRLAHGNDCGNNGWNWRVPTYDWYGCTISKRDCDEGDSQRESTGHFSKLLTDD